MAEAATIRSSPVDSDKPRCSSSSQDEWIPASNWPQDSARRSPKLHMSPSWVGRGRPLTVTNKTRAADHRLQRAPHHGHLTDPDKEPTMVTDAGVAGTSRSA